MRTFLLSLFWIALALPAGAAERAMGAIRAIDSTVRVLVFNMEQVLTIDVTGESYRGVKAKKLASRNKDA